MSDQPRYLTVPQAAETLNCSIKTIRRLIATGALPAWRLPSGSPKGHPRAIRIAVADLDALLRPIPAADPIGGAAA